MRAGPTTGPTKRCPRSYFSEPRWEAVTRTTGRPGLSFRASSGRPTIAHAAPSPIGQDIILVSGQATMPDPRTFSTVIVSVGWRWLIGFKAPLFQFLAAILARCSSFVPRSWMRRVAQRAKNAAGRIASSRLPASVPALLDKMSAMIQSSSAGTDAERHHDVVAPALDRPARLAEGRGPGRRRVLDALDREPGEPELLHDPHPRHGVREDLPDEGRLHVAKREPRVLERREPGLAAHVGVGLLGPHAEAAHADAEPRDVAHHRAVSPTGRKRRIITSRPASSWRSVLSSASSAIPTRYSSWRPASGNCTRGPSGRSTWPTP